MNITTIALALNIAIGVTVWQSELGLIAQIVLTVLLIAKFTLFFYTAWMSSSNGFQKAGAIALIVLNFAIIVYTLLENEIFIAITTGATLVLFVFWALAAIFCIGVKEEKDA